MRSKWLTYFGIFTFVLLGGALVGAPTANAASAFDNSYQKSDSIVVSMLPPSGATCSEIDITTTWATLLMDSPRHSTYGDSFENALDGDGRWGVSQEITGAGIITSVFWTEDDSLYLEWWGGGVQAKGNSLKVAQLWNGPSYGGSCGDVQIYDAFGASEYVLSYTDGSRKNSFVYTDNPNYPTDYEGEEIPDSPVTNVVTDYVPDWYASEADNWVVSLHDQNFNTFDGIEWTCSEDGNSLIEGGDGLAPVLYWQVWRDDFPTEGTNLLIDDGFQSATAPVMVELPINRDEAREYRVAGWYECGGTVDFTDASNLNFVVNAAGVLDESAALSNCISNEFPFIYLDDCVGNLAIFGKIALFGGATFNNTWTASTSCTDLTVFDDWLNLDNPTVCPNFPSEVRAVVTPFVTFIFGLITMKFLATRSGKDF